MATQTANMKLIKADPNDAADGTEFNPNWDTVESHKHTGGVNGAAVGSVSDPQFGPFGINTPSAAANMLLYGSGSCVLPAPATVTGHLRLLKAFGSSMSVSATSGGLYGPGSQVDQSFTLQAGDSALLACDGSNWWGFADATAILSSGATFSNGPRTADWFRNTVAGHGIVNEAVSCGGWFDAAGMLDYPHNYRYWHAGNLTPPTSTIVGINDTQTLTNKTILGATLSGTITGQPTWAQAQAFPGIGVGGGGIITTGLFVETDGVTISGTTPTTIAGQYGFGGESGIGNGAFAGMQAPAKASSSGPNDPVHVALWRKSSFGGQTYWEAMFQ